MCLNISQDILLNPHSNKSIQQAWVGDWFSLFYAVVIGYFVADLIWVVRVPECVKSPVGCFLM
jgi:hypothetical protein